MSISSDNIRERFPSNFDFVCKSANVAFERAEGTTTLFLQADVIALFQVASNLTIAETIEIMNNRDN